MTVIWSTVPRPSEGEGVRSPGSGPGVASSAAGRLRSRGVDLVAAARWRWMLRSAVPQVPMVRPARSGVPAPVPVRRSRRY